MSEPARILLIDDEQPSREALTLLLRGGGHQVSGAGTGASALALFRDERFDIVITDLMLPDMNGIDILTTIKEESPLTEVILITGHASAETAVSAMKQGAFDYITKPISIDELKIIIGKALEKSRLVTENVYLRKQLAERYEFDNIIGSSPAMQQLFGRMRKIIDTDSTVLLLGESGTGKELVAKALHFNGPRKGRPFVAVHCGAIPENLLESELFGHVKGAFTGAIRDKSGKFESADGGTIFLDEIVTMPLHLQSKLLRVLQEQEVERIGSTRPVKLNVRVISATNVDLEEEVRKGTFREDLYYRLNVIPICIPPLRERVQDILPLVRHFLDKYCRIMGRPAMGVTRETLLALEQYHWPGNVRELENLVERTVALADGGQVTPGDLPHSVAAAARSQGGIATPSLTGEGVDLPQLVSSLERQLIGQALEMAGGVKAKAAALLGLNRTTLVEKMRRLGFPL
jgi:DNA-binding NtrC family response regulator